MICTCAYTVYVHVILMVLVEVTCSSLSHPCMNMVDVQYHTRMCVKSAHKLLQALVLVPISMCKGLH